MTEIINVSETFLSIQGEGATMGTLSVFLRMQSCDFNCVWCDTTEVWRKGTPYTYEQLYKIWEDNGSIEALRNGAHLILTGGNPLLRQNEICGFLNYVKGKNYRFEDMIGDIELEQQGNMLPDSFMGRWINRYNISPKLGNSGVPKEKRIVKEAMEWYARQRDAIFKFVIDKPEDITEMVNDYIIPFHIRPYKVWLMPCASDFKQLHLHQEYEKDSKLQWVTELAIKNRWNVSDRLQIEIWDRTTGV
jgi:organic radical activating enzyme